MRSATKDSTEQFVRDGYLVLHGLHRTDTIRATREWVIERFSRLRERNKDVHEVAVQIMDELVRTSFYESLVRGPVQYLKHYLGPDICLLGYDALWINVPKDKDPVLLKGTHSDAWTGTSVNTIFVKTFFSDCDEHNGITMFTGTHLQGMWRVRNRKLADKVKLKGVNLKYIEAGDVLIWHPLCLHATTGHSAKNIRVSMTSRYTSTETAFSSQERALGYRTMSVGPLNKILRLVGNDHLTPMRTLGGAVAIDKRMRDVYGD